VGVLRYDERMTAMVYARLTPSQCSSLVTIAHSMSLTTGDVIRAAIDQFFEDIPEEPLFTRRVRLSLAHTHIPIPRR